VSIQIAILKILSSHPDGRASITSLNRDLAILTRSGREWAERLRRWRALAPAIDIFGSRYVLREPPGWSITPAGRDFLATLETLNAQDGSAQEKPGANDPLRQDHPVLVSSSPNRVDAAAVAPLLPAGRVEIIGRRDRRGRRRARRAKMGNLTPAQAR